MKEVFEYILSSYLRSKNDVFKDNAIADFLRKDAKSIIETKYGIDKGKYLVEGSPGKGRWADVPWIAVFDKDITTTAAKGYDIVYLFCSDMSGVYLSLNQGWTYFKDKYGIKKGKEKIKIVSDAWKLLLSSTLTDFSFEPISLKQYRSSADLAIGYELGHICGKFYKAGEIPSDAILIEDLRNLLGVYRELKGKLIDNSIEKTNNSLIVNHELGLLDGNISRDSAQEDTSDSVDIESIIESISFSTLTEMNPPESINSNESDTFTPRNTDFLKKAKRQKKLGFAGEAMVLKYEKDTLTLAGRTDLAKRVKHVSKEEGDGAGYDILSFDLNGNKKYIEVKTTTGSASIPFMLTATELRFSSLTQDNFYLYRVFEFDSRNQKGNFYILKGDISKHVELKPQQFIVSAIVSS